MSEDDISIWDTQIAKYVNEAKIKMCCHWTLSNREKKKKIEIISELMNMRWLQKAELELTPSFMWQLLYGKKMIKYSTCQYK